MKDTGISGAIAPQEPTPDHQWWEVRKSGGKDYITISVVSYHNDVRSLLDRDVMVFCPWPHWPVLANLEDILSKEDWERIVPRLYHDCLHGYPQPVEDVRDSGQSVFTVDGELTTVRKYVLRAMESTLEDSETVGGDDSFYDYFPDQVYCMWQLAKAVGLEDDYRYMTDHIKGGRYADDTEDLIRDWD